MSANEVITKTVTAWPGVEAGVGKRGEWGFRVAGKEIGHLHGDRVAHFFFPRDVGAQLREEGRVRPHPVNPHSPKMAARALETDADVDDAIALMRMNYERIVGKPEPFGASELGYLENGRKLGRIATVGKDGTPHVVPVGWSLNRELGTIDVGGKSLEETKKFRDVARSGRAAIVIDDLASIDPWRPRGIEIRGRAEAIAKPVALIRIHPERVRSWGLGD